MTHSITFEKQVPSKTRTQSNHSILSSISSKSALQQHYNEDKSHSQQNQDAKIIANSLKQNSLVEISQQIQSLAMCSVRRRGVSSAGTASPSVQQFRKSKEIGVKEPFIDTRINVDSHPTNQNSPNLESSPVEADADDDNEQLQKELTAMALKNLSILKTQNNIPETTIQQIESENEKIAQSDLTDLSNINSNSIGSMTHLQFGKKKVFLDSSTTPKHYPKKVPIQEQQPPIVKDQTPNANVKWKTFKQINTQKKPLYVPAVLRDISETNITNDEVMWSNILHTSKLNGNQINTYLSADPTAANASSAASSSKASVTSANMNLLQNCKNKMPSLFPQVDDTTTRSTTPQLEQYVKPISPTKKHWIQDSKRNACHYCHKLFTFWERKHHCRHCGDIFCQEHLRHWLYLDLEAEFIIGGGSGMGTLSKVCTVCAEDYEDLIKNSTSLSKLQMNLSKTMRKKGKEKEKDKPQTYLGAGVTKLSSKTGNSANAINITDSNKMNIDPNDGDKAQKSDQKKSARDGLNSVVGSVPIDWNWSSF